MNIHPSILIHFTVDGHVSNLGSLSIKKWTFWYMSFGAHRHTFLLCLAPELTSDKSFTFLRSFSFSLEQVNEVSLDRLSLPHCVWRVCRKLVLSTSLHSCSCFLCVAYVCSKLPDVRGVTVSFFLQTTSSRGVVHTSAASASPVSLL